MKTITNNIAAIALLSGFAFAGGDISPIEPEITMPEVETPISDNSFYLGLGYSYMTMTNDTLDHETTGNAITALAGYKFLDYLAVEARYSMTLGDITVDDVDQSWDMSNIGIYLKPQYTFDPVTVYALLGYGQVTFDNGTKYSADGFQWGLGASFAATEDIDVFVDYTRLYDDTGFDTLTPNNDIVVESINVGVNYNF